MKVRDAQAWLVRMPFSESISWGSGRRTGTTRCIVRLVTEDGTEGWGETISLIDAVPAVLRNLVLLLAVGYPVSEVQRFHKHVLGAGYYHHKRAAVMAICAVEMAMWDALGKFARLPLHALWGGRYRDSVEASAYVFVKEPDAMRRTLGGFLDRGFRTFKVKVGVDERSDLSIVETARREIGDLALRADVNGAWTPGTARRQCARLAPYDLAYVEQPLELDDLIGHVELRRSQPLPIALDESAYTLTDVGNIVRMGAADVVLLDPHEAGGLWQVIKAAAVCESAGIPVTLHSGGELALSQAAYVHLASALPNMSIAIDTERDYLAGDISAAAPVLRGGRFTVPDSPGLGIEVDMSLVDRYVVQRIEGAYLDQERPRWFPEKPAY